MPFRLTSSLLRGLARTAPVRATLARTLLLGAWALTGCGVDFDSVSELKGLRVIAVHKSAPYARPGETVELSMLYNDNVEEARDVQILWLSGCRNPPADLVQICFEVFGELFSGVEAPDPPRGEPSTAALGELFAEMADSLESSELPTEDLGLGVGLGETFSVTIDPEIISSRPPPADTRLPPYGLEYVYFAVCAGQLWLDSDSEAFPLGCFDTRGRRVGPERFVIGYTAIYAYDSLTNDNPRILGLHAGDKRLEEDEFCLGFECQTLRPEDSEGLRCPSHRRVKRCEDADQPGTCDKIPLSVLVDPDSVNDDGVLSSLQETPVREQMWVNYYADRGRFTYEVALVNDAQSGFNENTETEFIAPETPGVSHVWAVVRDNRGGVDWARFPVCVE